MISRINTINCLCDVMNTENLNKRKVSNDEDASIINKMTKIINFGKEKINTQSEETEDTEDDETLSETCFHCQVENFAVSLKECANGCGVFLLSKMF